MGCDIHLYVEKKENDEWISADIWELNDNTLDVSYDKKIYNERNYNLFAILANVRNGYGFAGINTGDEFVPISIPKGLPTDCDERIKIVSDMWGCDGHSHSWLTLKELLNYDWNQVNTHRGVVSKNDYYDFINRGKPKYYSAGVGGWGVKHITNETMKGLLDGSIKLDSNFSYYTSVEWKETYKESVKYFLNIVIPKLQSLGEPNDVRIVFWFDN